MPASPILLLVPYRNKAAVLYSQIPTSASASGDMVVSRAGVSTRINAQGNIESVAANVPRLNYPLGGVANGCPALLVEPTAQNLFFPSDDFATTIQTPATFNLNAFGSGSVSNTTATLDPFGTNLADYIQESTGTGEHRMVLVGRPGMINGQTYTASIFAKAAQRTIIRLNNNAGGGGAAIFDLVSGTITFQSGIPSGASPRIENYGNGWFRCSLPYTPNVSGNFNVITSIVSAVSGVNYTGTGVDGVYVFGFQIEQGIFATSYIPTTTGTVTRNADIVTNNTFVIPNLIGAILTEFDSPTSGTYFLDNIPIPIASGSNKIAISYTPTTLTIYRNGAQVSGSPATPPGGTAPVIGNVINIGHNNQLYQLGSGIKSFVLYSSTLSAAEASGLTT